MIAVAIDATPSAERALRTALELARARGERIVLVSAAQNGALGARADYLERLCRRLAAEGVRASAEVSRGELCDALADFVRRERPALVVH